MTKIVPFSTVFSTKFSFFLLFFAAVFLFSSCGSSTKIEPVSNTDEDSTDADFDMDEEEDWEEDEEMEDEEKNDTEAGDQDHDKTDLNLGNICTCQSECYKDFFLQDDLWCTDEGEDLFGQDAVYAALGTCVRKNYSIKETGIENENIIVDKNLNLEWQETVPEETYSWKDAVDYCKNLEYGGYDDWRIPAPKELFANIDNGRCDTETTDSYFKERYVFLTSKTYAGDPNQAWYADNSFGGMSFHNFSGNNKIYVRCVRGETIPEAAFILSTVGGDEIVTDSATGLIWQKGHASGKRWKEALEYCENLDYAGHTDWRLPNINELVSLMNYDRYAPASDFPDIPIEHFWSSTTAIPSSGAAWSVFIYTAQVISDNKDTFYHVKCVR